MSEKATLLTSIPPVKKAESDSGRPSLLTSTSTNQGKGEGKVSLLSQTKEATPAPSIRDSLTQKTPTTKPAAETSAPKVTKASQASDAKAVETVASEAVAEEPNSITAFQFLTYASFVLNFLLAGAAAVILFKKATKLAEERFVISAKTLGIASVLIMLHGFFATYLYAAHLNDTVSSPPLFLTMAVWVLVGPAVGFIARNLLARQEKPNRKAATIDAGIYGLIFFLAACALSSGIKTNAALLASIFAGFLMIVPIARSMTAFNVAKARHKELNETSDQILIYGLLFIPALLPILSFAHVCGLSDALTLFLINFITFDFVLVVALSMVASADAFVSSQAKEAAEVEAQPEAAEAAPEPVAAVATEVSAPEPVAEQPEAHEEPEPAKPQKVASGNPDDPIIQFLNSEEGEKTKPEAPAKPAAKNAPRITPPRKPGQPKIAPPKKPGSGSDGKSSAPNAPSRLKAPAKPKKRF